MLRPKPDLPLPGAIRALADAQGRLALRVTAGARTENITLEGGRVLVKVRAKPQDGAANDAVIALLAKALGIATSRLCMLGGTTSRNKLIQIKSR